MHLHSFGLLWRLPGGSQISVIKSYKNKLGIPAKKTDLKCASNPFAIKIIKKCEGAKVEKVPKLGIKSYYRLGGLYIAGISLGFFSFFMENIFKRC